VRDLAALEGDVLRKLGLVRPAVLGFGFGGWLAAELATQCGPCFSQMVLVAPFGLRPETGEIFDQFLGRGPRYARAGFADTVCYEATYGPEPDIDTLENWEINREMTARVAWAPYLFNQALPHLLPAVDIHTLVLWGEEDAIIPRLRLPAGLG
jgi:pimeloyl-ACP methyl ester carboxylesterase